MLDSVRLLSHGLELALTSTYSTSVVTRRRSVAVVLTEMRTHRVPLPHASSMRSHPSLPLSLFDVAKKHERHAQNK